MEDDNNKLFDGDFIDDKVGLNISSSNKKPAAIEEYGLIHKIFSRISDLLGMIGAVGAGFFGGENDNQKPNNK
mgnify:CR=1 FL=1